MTRMECPVRHGEGKYVMPSPDDLNRLAEHHQLTVRYVDPSTPAGAGSRMNRFRIPSVQTVACETSLAFVIQRVLCSV